jgi:polyhydroxybutyrate depolymerase
MKSLLRTPSLLLLTAGILAGCGGRSASPAARPTPIPPSVTPSPAVTSTPTPAPLVFSLAQRKVTVGPLDRTYYLYVPKYFAPGTTVPVVFIFHGYSGEGALMISATGFNKIADAAGFLVVYPDGTGPAGRLSWNAGGCCGSAAAGNVDESAFVGEILRDLADAGAAVDPDRIYAAGFSNGGMLSYRLACDMSETFAAVAPVAGILLVDACRPAQPVSLLHIHGTADTVVPFTGPNPDNPAWPAVQDGITVWAGFDGCDPVPQTGRKGIAARTVYPSCAAGSAVELYLLDGVGHQWPGEFIWPASQTIWNFFAAHPKI